MVIGQLVQEQKVLYWVKELGVLNFCAIPLLALVALYIFLRDEKLTFDYNFLFMSLLIVGYVVLVYIYKTSITIDNAFGFVVTFKNYLTPTLIYLIILSTLAVISLLYVDKPFSNKGGMRLLMISLMISVAEAIMFLGGIKIFPYPIIGEAMLLITTYKAINTFKEKK